jgi:hypothetical protein
MMGPGKYDDACTRVRGEVGLADGDQGGVILIVFGGHKGNGFSCQADLRTTLALPEILESIAKQIREDSEKGIGR